MSTDSPKRIVVLISGSGSNLQALIDACKSGQILGNIIRVISNRPDVLGLERAAKQGIATSVINHKDFPGRQDFDRALQAEIDQYDAELVVLAGFMRILTPEFVAHYSGRLLNIHPSLLPKYKGTHTHRQALEDGANEHGVSVHFVTAELDGGPVIMQAHVPILANDTETSLAERVLTQEHLLYPRVVALFCAGRLQYKDHLPVFDGEVLRSPLLLQDRIT